jgi:hypothetical protein
MSPIPLFLSRSSSPLRCLFIRAHYLLTVHQQDLLPTLSQFKNLEELVLADASSLGVGFNPPMCGNVYMGPDGDEVRRQVQEEAKQARNDVMKAVMGACTGLKRLWIGRLGMHGDDREYEE